jgi:hypothetical protein
MAAKAKFSNQDLQVCLDEGLSQAQIAAKFNCTVSAVCARIKKTKTDLTAAVVGELVDLDPSNLKEKPSPQELRFIHHHLVENLPIVKSMDLAGYGQYSQDWKYKLAKKIIIRYESRADDHREICRLVGAGEVVVITGLLDLAKNAKSEPVRHNAWQTLAKILGLTQEQLESGGGLTVIFEANKGQAQPVGVPPVPVQGQAQPQQVLPPPGKPLMITR